MNIELLTGLETLRDMERFAALAALTCHANTDKPYDPQEVLQRIIQKGHESILEHINPHLQHQVVIAGMSSGTRSSQAYQPKRREHKAHSQETD